ncbi:DinB family protein [Streptomyces sp. NBC_01268]|nr:DinB family protein [Streptomyces sp. NBC_01268]
MKCEGLDDEKAAVASVPPSAFTLTGLVQHMAEVERHWFRRVCAGEQAPPIYDPQADPDAPDGGFEPAEGATLRDALATWHAETARAREHCADRALPDTGRFMEQDVSLRWIYVHMIEEYAATTATPTCSGNASTAPPAYSASGSGSVGPVDNGAETRRPAMGVPSPHRTPGHRRPGPVTIQMSGQDSDGSPGARARVMSYPGV